MKYKALILVGLMAFSTVFASEVPKDPKKQTSWGLYVDSKEAYEMKKKTG